MRENKEQTGQTIRFSVRLPKYQHTWIKNRSYNTKGTSDFESMNKIISEAVEQYMIGE